MKILSVEIYYHKTLQNSNENKEDCAVDPLEEVTGMYGLSAWRNVI
jgi:hypothetical protein